MGYIPQAPGTYQGRQVIINSDRLLFNAKTDSILFYSKEAIGFSTNGSFHFDTSFADGNRFIVNAPDIYLGLNRGEELPTEPAVLGDSLGEYQIELLDMIEDLIDVIIDNLQWTCPSSADALIKTTGPYDGNEKMVKGIKDRIQKLMGAVNDFKSDSVKII